MEKYTDRFWIGVGFVLLVLIGIGAFFEAKAQPKQFLVDLPMPEGRADIQRAVEQGYNVVGVDYERHTLSILSEPGQAIPVPAVRVKEVAYAPDEQYKKPEDVERILRELESKNPGLVKVESIGKSLEGRETLAVRIGYGKPKSVLVDAMHHAREVITPEVALDIAEQLVARKDEPKVAAWLQKFDVYVVPMVNPDGNAKVWSGYSMWRKNTRGGYGVDINRNYPTDFNRCNGSSGNRNSETYRGSGPASEPETKNLIALAGRIKPLVSLSYHSFSEIVIYPYGCSGKRIEPQYRAKYEGMGRELAKRLVTDSGRGRYRAGTSYDLLYDVDGGSTEHMWKAFGAYAFTVEVNGSSMGFQPPYRYRDTTVQRQRAGWEYLFDEAAKLATP